MEKLINIASAWWKISEFKWSVTETLNSINGELILVSNDNGSFKMGKLSYSVNHT